MRRSRFVSKPETIMRQLLDTLRQNVDVLSAIVMAIAFLAGTAGRAAEEVTLALLR